MHVGAIASPEFDLGGLTVRILRGGALRLDGGAMFGIIPKALWSRKTPADESNRIQLACNCLLVEWPGSARRVIVEVGHGPKYEAKECNIFAIDPARWLLPALVEQGVDPDTITDVVLTHLHFDHAGGLTHEFDGRIVATFPKARVHVQRREFEDARVNFGIMTATYREANFEAIDAAGAWRLLEGEEEILPNLGLLRTPGHTRGHHSIVLRGSQRTLVFAGDVLPTAAHLGAPWNMAYDVLPLENRQSKRRLLELAERERAVLVLDHEPGEPAWMVARQRDWFTLMGTDAGGSG